MFGKGKKNRHGGERIDVNYDGPIATMIQDEIEFEPEMTLTQMVDLLTGKDNKLSKHLQATFDLQTKFVETLSNLDKEVSKPGKQQDKDRVN